MVIAALICFFVLLLAWIVAPDDARGSERTTVALEPELAPTA